jgi:hypothetical protein
VKTTTTAPANNACLPKGWRMVRFDELAQMVTERVDPSATDADIYVGLEHLDPDSLKLRRWGTPSDVIGEGPLPSLQDSQAARSGRSAPQSGQR